MKKFDFRKPLIFVLLVALIAVGVIVFGMLGDHKTLDLSEGREYIKNQESLEVSTLENSIKEKRADEREDVVIDGDGDIFSKFEDYVFYGDSRVLHFVSYGYLEPTRVLANNGYSFQNVSDWDSSLRALNPKNIYLAFGSNEINQNIYYGNDKQYKKIVIKAIKHIQSIAPDAHLYVLGMIPPNSLGQSQMKQFKLYKNINKVYQEVCEEMDNVTYIDDEVLGQDGEADIYTLDGFHFVSDFYPTWAEYILSHAHSDTE
ncbi:MAG: hypothetical protein KBT48_12195 [Firmicutes bacterium]|nr:hypothetical protein [Bacillota bacterium]